MDDQPTLLRALTGLLMAVLGWAALRIHSRVDTMERSYVSRDEFNKILDRWQEERHEMHRQNLQQLERISDRVDDLWERS